MRLLKKDILELVQNRLRLFAVRKAPETHWFLVLGRFETEGSNLRYGIPKGVATVRPHLRKVSIKKWIFT